MRIGIRLAISGLVLASIMVSAIGVHVLWWRTAETNSQTLAATINEQIVAAVEKELETITAEARAAHTAIRTLFVQNVLDTREADKREFVFLSQLQSQPGISWVAFGWPDGALLRRAQARRSGPGDDGDRSGRRRGQAARRRLPGGGRRHRVREAQLRRHRFRRHRSGMVQERHRADEPRWFEVTAHPDRPRPSIAFAGPIDVYQKRQGVLADHHRIHAARAVSRRSFRSARSGAAFILGRERTHDRRARSGRRRNQHAALGSAVAAGRAGRVQGGRRLRRKRQEDRSPGEARRRRRAYAVTPDPAGLSRLDARHRHSGGGVSRPGRNDDTASADWARLLILAAGVLSAWLARRVIAAPLVTVADALGHVAALRARPGAAHVPRISPRSRTCREPSPIWRAGWRRFANTSPPTW